MPDLRQFTALIERQDDGYVAPCLEYDVVSQGKSIKRLARTWLRL